MSRVCLDTSAYSHYKRGNPEIVDEIDRAAWVGLPSIVLGELYTGFILGHRARRNEDELREFLSNPLVHVLAADEPAARIYTDIVVELRRCGTPIPTNDAWIASMAAREGATVLTCDDHFSSIKRVGAKVIAVR